jgi:ABC-type branched-subunit amino acid transport system substrate-binding protein
MQTINARDIIASVHLPLIAPTASSANLSGTSPYFFRICPSTDSQGWVLGSLLTKTLHTKKILILRDPTDAYSVSLSNAVAARIMSMHASFTEGTFTENATTVQQYEQMVVANANSDAPADAIFLAGFNVDGIRLAHAVGEMARVNSWNMQLRNLKIVSGDGMDSNLLLGQGKSADADIANEYPQDMRRLTFTTFADFNESDFLHLAQDKQSMFFSDWKATYQDSVMGNTVPDPTNEGLMIYDAVGVYVHAASLVHGSLSGDALRKALLSLGKGNVVPYQGVSGRIMFDGSGNPIDKALVILTVQQGNDGNEIGIQQVLGTFK